MLVFRGELHRHVVEGETTDKHPDIAASQPLLGKPGVIEGLPAHLEQQALLRIHVLCLMR